MASLDYSSDKIEKFGRNVIACSYDENYKNFIWKGDTNDFDFISPDNKIALEITIIISNNEQEAVKYEKAIEKGKVPNKERIKWGYFDEDGQLLSYCDSSMDEIRKNILNAIKIKESKRLLKQEKHESYELCLLINDGGLFNTTRNFDFIFKSKILKEIGFNKIFIITSNNFFVIQNNTIKEYNRKIC